MTREVEHANPTTSGLRRRLIPVVLMRGGVAVQSKGFGRYQRLGNPTTIVERLSDFASDELIYLDITRGGAYDGGRDDLADAGSASPLDILRDIARRCFMPLAFGGGIRTIDDCEARIAAGADKVVLNSQALSEPAFIDACARAFGSQCVVVCIDARAESGGGWGVYADGGKASTGRGAADWAREAADRGAGEILIQSIDRDGSGRGYDTGLIRTVADAVPVPVIALGGVGEWSHLGEGLEAGADAVAAANIFNYTEHSVYRAKRHLFEAGFDVREPALGYGLDDQAGERAA